ncbi:MAG: hypothetical protein GY756_09955 [bacterium]|nr:hypothetical protein [bacterium]
MIGNTDNRYEYHVNKTLVLLSRNIEKLDEKLDKLYDTTSSIKDGFQKDLQQLKEDLNNAKTEIAKMQSTSRVLYGVLLILIPTIITIGKILL